jgi:hypothetical protein
MNLTSLERSELSSESKATKTHSEPHSPTHDKFLFRYFRSLRNIRRRIKMHSHSKSQHAQVAWTAPVVSWPIPNKILHHISYRSLLSAGADILKGQAISSFRVAGGMEVQRKTVYIGRLQGGWLCLRTIPFCSGKYKMFWEEQIARFWETVAGPRQSCGTHDHIFCLTTLGVV